MRTKIQAGFIILFFIISACSSRDGVEKTNKPALNDPEKGKATVIGRVVSISSKEPIANTPVRLAEVVRQGDEAAFVLDGAFSPGDITDENGFIVIEGVDPMEYVIIVGDVYGKYEIIAEQSGQARVYETIADQILDVGDLLVDL